MSNTCIIQNSTDVIRVSNNALRRRKKIQMRIGRKRKKIEESKAKETPIQKQIE